MTYSLHTLTQSAPEAAPRSGVRRFSHEIVLIFGLLALAFWLMAMLSYSAQDVAWSTSGSGEPLHNWGGRLGAWASDMSYFLFGFSAWWCLIASTHVWLATLAVWMRDHEAPVHPKPTTHRAIFWLGLVLLLSSSSALEWSRLYRLEAFLPGHGGGVLGYWLGPLSVKWLGFAGSGLVAITLGLVGVAMVFGFSWGHVAERLGAWLATRLENLRAKRERELDLALGKQAAREREDVVEEER